MYWYLRTALAVLSVVVVQVAAAQAIELTERQAVERALARSSLVAMEEGLIGAAQAEADEAGLWPNPELVVERDRTGSGDRRSTETSVKVEQAIDLSGRRALRREAMLRRLDATRLEQRDRRLGVAREVRRTHAETLHAAELDRTLVRWSQRLARALATISRQVEAGEASGYERRRIEREVQAIQTRRSAAEADAMRTRVSLAGWVEISGEWQAGGVLIPTLEPPLERYLSAAQTRADVVALEARSQASARELDAANRAWIPDLGIGVGAKRIEESGHRDSGFLVTLSVPLPLFNRGAAAAAKARSVMQSLQAERELKVAEAQARVRGHWMQARALREAATQLQGGSVAASRELSGIAETAWRGGEATLLELLDAYRSELEAEITALDLAFRARIARIEVDHLSGIE